ncbi:MAG: DUF2726 domain-containing protein [Maricaulaceae bacterium]
MSLNLAYIIAIVIFGVAVFIKLGPSKNYAIANYDKFIFKYYSRSKSLFTPNELIFYRVLRKHLNDEYIIASMVRLADFIDVREHKLSAKPKSTTPNFNRISSKHADFLIIDLFGKPLLWIELDNKSHNSRRAKKADKFKDELAHAIGLPMQRIKTGTDYNAIIKDIKSRL